MARTIEELEKGIAFNEQMLAAGGGFLSKTIKGGLEREIASLKKRIEEIRLAQVRLADGTIVGEGSRVWGYVLPTLDKEGNAVNFQVHSRTVQETKRDTSGIGYVAFQKATAKFQRLNWYEAARFASSEDGAIEMAEADLIAKADEAEREAARARELLNHVQYVRPKVNDLTKNEED